MKDVDIVREGKIHVSHGEHCHFNRRRNEILQCVFKANMSEQHELLVNQLGGGVRTVSIIYQRKEAKRIRQS